MQCICSNNILESALQFICVTGILENVCICGILEYISLCCNVFALQYICVASIFVYWSLCVFVVATSPSQPADSLLGDDEGGNLKCFLFTLETCYSN